MLRLFHGHMDECLSTSPPEQGDERRLGGSGPIRGGGDCWGAPPGLTPYVGPTAAW